MQKPRYFTIRRGRTGDRHFFQPSRILKREGWKLTRLSDVQWEARAQALWIGAVMDAVRDQNAAAALELLDRWAHGQPGGSSIPPAPWLDIHIPGLRREQNGMALQIPEYAGKRSIAALIAAYRGDPAAGIEPSEEFADKGAKTRRDYGYHLDAIAAYCGDLPVSAINKKRLRDYHKALRAGISLHTANARLRVFSLLLAFAEREMWLPANSNPALRLKFKQPDPRVVIITQDEQRVLIETCEDAGRHDVADVILAGIDIGQRQSDLFAMHEGQWDGTRWRIAQGKRGAVVFPEPTAELSARLEAARKRRARMNPALISPQLFLNEETRAPWAQSTFNKEFAKLRAAAAKKMPSIARLKFLDTRDTYVTRAAIAGASIAQIRAVTGHTPGAVHNVIKHYLGNEPELAASSAKCLKALLKQIEATQRAA